MHLLPGRLRLQSEILKGDPELADHVCQTLECAKGVREARVSSLTGSITVYFDQETTTGHALINFLIRKQWISNVIPFPGQGIVNGKTTTGISQIQSIASSRVLDQRRVSPQLVNKIALTAVKLVLPIIIERYLGKTASKFVSSII